MRRLIIMFLLLVWTGACTSDFEELNTNPNAPVEVSPQYLLPQALQTTVDNYWGNRIRNERLNFDHAMCWVQHLTRNIYENEGDNYNVQPSVNITNWEVFYTDGLINFEKIRELSSAEADVPNSNYEGIGIGMRAWTTAIITDVWGAVPFTDALKGTAEEAVFSPGYDAQPDVYAQLIDDLATANALLNPDGPAVKGDIMFNGDVMMWKKFFNSTRFKLLNRQAHVVSGSGEEMQAMLDDPDTWPMISSNDEIAELVYGAVPTGNPWNDILVQQGRTDWNISSTLVNKMKALDDPRLDVFAQPGNQAEGEITGHPNGLPGATATTFLGFSATINVETFAQVNSPAVLMSYSELLFNQAEAALDGDINGNAEELFAQAVAASFDQYGLEVPGNYIASLGTLNKEVLMTQKWIALFGQGIEAWTELRRTGFPVLPEPDPRAQFQNDGVLPTRMIYPSTEYSLNGEQVQDGVSFNEGPDNMKTPLWWVEN